MAVFELRVGDHRAAAVLARELVAPPQNLLTRIHEAELRDAVERQELRQLRRFEARHRPRIVTGTPWLLLALSGVLWTILTLFFAGRLHSAHTGSFLFLLMIAIVTCGTVFLWARHRLHGRVL